MGDGGLDDCGNAQNCVRACPKSIPLTTAIAEMFRATTVHGLKKALRDMTGSCGVRSSTCQFPAQRRKAAIADHVCHDS